MTPEQAIEFVRTHGVVLESASGSLPSLTRAIVGGDFPGNWWAHPKGKQIFRMTRAVRASPEVLVCRLAGGRITFVHERVWPALAYFAARYDPARIARLTESHTSTGRHLVEQVPFDEWLPDDARQRAMRLTLDEASAMLGPLAPEASAAG